MTFTPATVVVAMSSRMGGCRLAGMPKASGLVLSVAVRPPGGATIGTLLVQAKPISPASAANRTYGADATQCPPWRTPAQAMPPFSRACSMHHSMARTEGITPSPRSPSRSNDVAVSDTTRGHGRGFSCPPRRKDRYRPSRIGQWSEWPRSSSSTSIWAIIRASSSDMCAPNRRAVTHASNPEISTWRSVVWSTASSSHTAGLDVFRLPSRWVALHTHGTRTRHARGTYARGL
jgi:hypothetical protein